MNRFGGLLLVLILGAGALYQCREYFTDLPKIEETAPVDGATGESEAKPSLRVLKNSWFETEYGLERGSLENDLQIVSSTITESQTMIKDFAQYFIPDNQALTAFLSGKNRDRLAWIQPGNKAISEEGELLDRYGTPLFFHRESATRFQVRSAGVDRVMWTDDDVLYPKSKVDRLQ